MANLKVCFLVKFCRFGISFWLLNLKFSFFFRWIKFFLKNKKRFHYRIFFHLRKIKYLFQSVYLLILFIEFMTNDYNFWRTKILLDRYYNVALFIYEYNNKWIIYYMNNLFTISLEKLYITKKIKIINL